MIRLVPEVTYVVLNKLFARLLTLYQDLPKMLISGRKANQEHELKVFKARRLFVVMTALAWLVKFVCLYRDFNILINDGNLNWMDGADRCFLPIQYSTESNGYLAEDGDIGPAPDQT
jgi:hypothetical protein